MLAADRTREDTRLFALQCLEAGAPWVVSATSGPEPQVVIGRAKANAALDLRAFVPELLAAASGKGGGSPDMITIAAAEAGSVKAAFELAKQKLA